VTETVAEKNKAIVRNALETLFNRRDYVAAERFWSANYIQHSAHIPPGRDGLFNLIKSIPPTLRYEAGVMLTEGEVVIVHGRFSGIGQPTNWIVVDIIRLEDGVLAEHWDVIEDEASKESSRSGLPMAMRFPCDGPWQWISPCRGRSTGSCSGPFAEPATMNRAENHAPGASSSLR
jgi:predicted SnoaL-like aldol condensation-catalyzing enzyme